MRPAVLSRRRACLLLAGLALPPITGFAAPAALQGAGATFPAPLYTQWAARYLRETGVAIHYQAVGSGAGVQRITQGQVDFGATDAPLTPAALQAANLLQFPATVGGVVPVANLAGVGAGELKLTGSLLADIYLGHVRKWNDPAIALLNPGISLPSANITVVHRGDASGTSFLWSSYLARTSTQWQAQVGAGTLPAWPLGVADSGNEGVAVTVRRTRHALGYVEYAYAKAHRLPHASLRNRDGQFAQPGQASFAAAAQALRWQASTDLAQLLVDAPGAGSWPIAGASYILLPTGAAQSDATARLLKFFDWALRQGRAQADALDYAQLPEAALALAQQQWREQLKDAQGQPLWPANAPNSAN